MSKVSIVMLVYNHERFIGQALDSILMQNTQYTYELIIGEDCSTDSSRRIIQSYEQKFGGRMKPIYRDRNIGMARNLIDCMKQCSGEYIAFLEGDDYWTDTDKLQLQVEYLEEHKEFAAVAHMHNVVDAKGKVIRNATQKENKVYTLESMNACKIMAQTSTWVGRNIYNDMIEKYGKALKKYVWIPMDTTIISIVLTYGKVLVMPKPMSAYRYYIEENGSNWSSMHEIEAKNNYLYFYLMWIGLEGFSKRIGYSQNLEQDRLKLFWNARDQWHRSKKIKVWLQCILMILIEPRKIRFISLILEEGKRRKENNEC